MLRIGLTGGIASGKSTVVGMLRELGCAVLEADPLAHQLMEPGQPAYDEIVAEFGREILDSDGCIHRPRLGAIVFADPARRARLNEIVHPRVVEASEAWFAELERAGREPFAVHEAALLIEAGYHTRMDRLVVVWCRPEQQRERLLARGLSPQQAEQRLAAQMPLEEKCRLADEVIDASGPLEQTRRQTEALVARLRKLAAV